MGLVLRIYRGLKDFLSYRPYLEHLERETGIEPATFSLGS